MIQILKNSRSEKYQLLKKNILGQYFPWYYYNQTTVEVVDMDGHKNISQFAHTFISRPEEYGWSKHDSPMHQLAVDVVRYILFDNEIHPDQNFILRLAANCVFPCQGVQYSLPHIDHHFPHLNFITYLTNSGGSTFIEGIEHKPQEDQSILFSGEHYLQLPEKERRIVLVATIYSM